jgi:hypothetical protein
MKMGNVETLRSESAVLPISSSSAICPTLLPMLWINRTVSALYLSENFRRFRLCFFAILHFYRAYFRAFRSVHQTGASPDS